MCRATRAACKACSTRWRWTTSGPASPATLAARPVTARTLLRAAQVPVPPHGPVAAHAGLRAEALRIWGEASGRVRVLPVLPAPVPLGAEGDTVLACAGAADTLDALTDLLTHAAPAALLMWESDIAGQSLWIGILDDGQGDPYALRPLPCSGMPPADRATLARARRLALRAHQVLLLRGLSLHRFTRSKATQLLWREVQTQPDLSPTGLLPQMATAHHQYAYAEFIYSLLDNSATDRTAWRRTLTPA